MKPGEGALERRRGGPLAAREHATYVRDARRVLLWASFGMLAIGLFLAVTVGMSLYDYRTRAALGSEDAGLAALHLRAACGALAALLRFAAAAGLFALFQWSATDPRPALRAAVPTYIAVFLFVVALRLAAGEIPLHRGQIVDLIVLLALSRGARSAAAATPGFSTGSPHGIRRHSGVHPNPHDPTSTP